MTDDLTLTLPSRQYEKEVRTYRNDFFDTGDSIGGSNGLEEDVPFEQWLKQTLDDMDQSTVQSHHVPATTYLAIRKSDNKLIGMIQVRHQLNEFLTLFGGHIGYSVRPSERRKGYAKAMLHLALLKCHEMGIDKALVTCDKNNIASAKTILANGGILEDEVASEGRITQRYWIHTSATVS